MKFLVTVLISGVLAWFVVGFFRMGTAAPDAVVTPRANTEAPAVLTAPTVAEITALAPEKRLNAITRFSQFSSVREIMEALGQLDELGQREAGLASQVLFKRWAELAPEQAMRYVLAKQDGDSSVMFDEFRVILTVLRTTDPAHPLDLLMKCNPYYFNTGWPYGIDVATLLATITRYPKTDLSDAIAQQIFKSMVPTNPTTGAIVATVADLNKADDAIAKMPPEIQGLFYGELASAWAQQAEAQAKSDLSTAMAWARAQPADWQATCISTILQNKLKRAKDLATVESIFSQTTDPGASKELLSKLTTERPELALAWFTAHANEPSVLSQRRLQEESLRNVASKNPDLALSWLEVNRDISETLRDETLATVAKTLSPKDPARAWALAGGLSKTRQRWLSREIAPALAKLDLDAGLAVALKGHFTSDTLAKIVNDWKSTSEYQTQGLQPMIDKLSALAPDKLGEVISPSFFKTIPAYQDFLNQLTPEQRDGALKTGASALLNADFTAAANYFAKQAPGPGRSEAMAETAVTFAETNPTAGTTWLAALPEDNAKSLAIRNFANSYFKSHETEAITWMESLPAAQADSARTTYVGILSNNGQSATAWEQALKFSNAETQAQSLAQVVSGWKDPAAAQSAISASKLDPKTKQSLSEKISAQ